MRDEAGKLNGSVNLLADAMHKVFSEAVEGAVEPLTTEMKALRTDVRDMGTRLDKRIDGVEDRLEAGITTTNENVQSQLAQHRKGIAEDVGNLLKAAD